jgi:hypothetical protein
MPVLADNGATASACHFSDEVRRGAAVARVVL